MFGWLHKLVTAQRKGRTDLETTKALPKLVAVTDHPLGGQLLLSDGSRVVIDISPEWFEKALAWIELPPNPGMADVYLDPIRFDEPQWRELQGVLLASPSLATVFDQFPGLRRQLQSSFDEVVNMPFHVYGGSTHYQVYLSHPVGFRPSDAPSGRPGTVEGWFHAVLHQPGGHAFSTWVNVTIDTVVVQSHRDFGEWMEEGSPLPKLESPTTGAD